MSRKCMRVCIRGAVQGVGFRPFVYRLASELQLAGWVRNTATGLTIEVEGDSGALVTFLSRLKYEHPAHAVIQGCEDEWHGPAGHTAFTIRPSVGGTKTALILPDLGTCPDCLAEIRDPADRRYRYPFTNCTNCGPRFSIVEALPYDRRFTTMRKFLMCDHCRREYEDPGNRRFHAQPNACPVCGPQLSLWDERGETLAIQDEALLHAAQAIRQGQLVAVKGLGGFHLVCAARDEAAVKKLRQRKGREEKPLALMAPDLATVRRLCETVPAEEDRLTSQNSPIVLLRRRVAADRDEAIAPSVAPGNPNLGVMLPYTPLHHLLLADLGFPVVATSGNLSDEPICTEEREALHRLTGIADLYLVHDRPIARHVDDSIVRFMAGREQILRRARGYAPLPISLPDNLAVKMAGSPASGQSSDRTSLLAVGGHLKNTVALSVGTDVYLSQHIGDLETAQASHAFHEVIDHFQRVYEQDPPVTVCDAHPDYLSTRYAHDRGARLLPVQHHLAHVLACLAENRLKPPVLGVSWDGTGHGLDGTIWGGEFIRIDTDGWRRFASFRTFPLPGGERAIREPRRTAMGVLHEIYGTRLPDQDDLAPVAAFTPRELGLLGAMLDKRINTPLTSSAGRLFDAVSALLDVRQVMTFEGQAAMELEFLLEGVDEESAYPIPLMMVPDPASRRQGAPDSNLETRLTVASDAGHVASACYQPGLRLDWQPLFEALLADLRRGEARGVIAKRFHNALVEAMVMVAQRAEVPQVVLTGGCFQNRYLLERSITRLRESGYEPAWHAQVPPNDGGIALGQIVAATTELARESAPSPAARNTLESEEARG